MRILHSTSRSALRDKCLREICSLTAGWPDKRAILLVPEQTKMDMERDYLAMSGQTGLMMAEVLSFRRLAWRLLGEIGRQPAQAVDSTGQALLIHRILKQNQDQLHAFGHLADRPGFISQVAAALGDLKRYQIDADRLSAAAVRIGDKALENKSLDLGLLLREYDAALQQSGLCDAEDDLTRLGEVLQALGRLPAGRWPWPWQNLAWLRRTSVWISGFGELRDFTPQEDMIIQALHHLCEQVTLTVAADRIPFDRLTVDAGPDFFLPGRKTAWRLLQNLPAESIEQLPDQLAGFQEQLAASMREGLPCPPEVPDDRNPVYLQLMQANGLDSELAFVAGEIRRLVQLEGCRYQDIAIAACDLPGSLPRLRATCREYGIPLFMDAARSLNGTPLLRFILGLLDIGLRGWTPAAVMSCLRSGLTPLPASDIDRLENEMLARGSFQPDRLFEDARYAGKDLLAIRDQAFQPLKQVLAEIGKSASSSLKCQVLRRFLQDYGLPSRISIRVDQLAAAGETDAAAALVQAWNELENLFEQIMTLNKDAAMPLKTFRETLAAGMDSASSSLIPSAIDQVSVGDLKRAVLRQPRVLFLIGATAAALPPTPPPEGLLKDQDRQTLSGLMNCQLPSSARDQAFADAFTCYTLLTLPRDRLYVTTPASDVSPWFKWLAGSVKGKILLLADQPAWDDVRLNALRPALGYLLRYCSLLVGEKPPAAEQAGWLIVARVLAAAGMPLDQAAGWLRTALSANRQNEPVSSGLVRSLYGPSIAMSVSQLEKYASCPFLHFASYLLTLQERQVWQPEAAETGTLLHGIVELALRELRLDLEGLAPGDEAGWRQTLEHWLASDLTGRSRQWLETAACRDKLDMFFDLGLRASAGRRAYRLAASSLQAILHQYQCQAYQPASLEWTFGPTENAGLTLLLGDGTAVAFRGKIDRIDLAADNAGTRFRIIDYKSGNKKADYDALFHGLALQLPAYLEAYGRNNPGSRPDDAAYFHFDRPILALKNGSRPAPEAVQKYIDQQFALRGLKLHSEQLELLCRHTMRQAANLASQLLGGNFAVQPRKLPGAGPACDYCEMQALCGFDDRPDHYFWLPPLTGHLKPDGRPLEKRAELIMQLQEQAEKEGGAGDGTYT